jgi:hypothetical protein
MFSREFAGFVPANFFAYLVLFVSKAADRARLKRSDVRKRGFLRVPGATASVDPTPPRRPRHP